MRKLDEIVREYYIERLGASQVDERYPMFLQRAITGLKDLNMDIKSVVTEAVLPINSNDTVTLPSNYLDYLVIGVIEDGAISSLGMNNNLPPRDNDDCGDLKGANTTEQTERAFFGFNSSHFSKDGQFVGRHFGAGGGGSTNGLYKVYKDKGYISLNGVSTESIVLRYYATLEQLDGNFMVDEYQTEALKDWIWWKSIQNQRSFGIGEKQLAEMSYNKQKKKSEKRNYRFNIIEFINAFDSGYRSSPRI